MITVGFTSHEECKRLDPIIYDASSVLVRMTGHDATATIEGILKRIVEELDVDRGTILESDECQQTIAAAMYGRAGCADVELRASRLKSLLSLLGATSDIVVSSEIATDAALNYSRRSLGDRLPIAIGAPQRAGD